MKKILTLLTILILSLNGFTQNENNEPYCIIFVHSDNTPLLLTYLFSRYGIDDSERITLNIQNYELNNNVLVMDNKTYLEYIENIDNQLIGQTDPNKISILELEKLKAVNILTIEAIVIQ